MTSAPSRVRIEPVRPEHARALTALFEAAGCACHCRYWHFDGDKNEWLDRCANAPEVNRRLFEDAVHGGDEEARGLVALFATGSRDVAAGWLKIAPAHRVDKAYDQRLYRRLPCFDGDRAGVFLIACALIHPSVRHQGVARAMVEHAVQIAPSWSVRVLEALPRRAKEPVSDEELWTVPFRVFEACGFDVVHDFEPYPVVRKEISRHE